MKRKTLSIAVTLVLFTALAIAQKADKKWTEWTKKDAQKILDDSPWAQIQNDTDTREGFFSPTSAAGVNGAGSTSNDSRRLGQGATNQSTNVKFHVRFFSARPIREAHARLMELAQPGAPPEALARLRSFGEVKSETSIIVTVTFEATDQRSGNDVMQAFNSAVTSTLKNNTYLQRSDGKQLFLEEYVPPGKDGFGARFIFLRLPDDKPFIDANTKEIRFFAQLSGGVKVDRRFKVSEMMYQGELEY